MKSFLIPFVLRAAFLAADDLHAHGGTYKGPGDIVPPGGTPTQPGTPVTPTPPGPTGPTGASTPGGAALPLEDELGWQYWWEFNKDRFLNVRARLHDAVATDAGGPLTGLYGAGAPWSTSPPSATASCPRCTPRPAPRQTWICSLAR